MFRKGTAHGSMYPDAIGAKTPHIRVQVKHRPSSKATREEVAALRGIIRQDREIGLFVSSFGFTSGAVQEARNGSTHIELMDLDRFLDHWMAHYERMTEEDKANPVGRAAARFRTCNRA
jgi:restriction system protein